MHVPIRRPCRRHGTACRIQTQQIRMPISICRSQTPQNPPQRPCAFRPAIQKHANPWFLWFSFRSALAEPNAKKTVLDGSWCEYASRMQASRCLFHDFHALTHFPHHFFSKLCFLPTRGAQFCKTASSNFDQNFYFFHPQTASKRACVIILFAHIALLAVPIAIFSLFDPFKILIIAHDLCISSL